MRRVFGWNLGRSLAAAIMLLGGMVASGSALAGSAAWTNEALVLREGPGAVYDVTGQIAGEIKVVVDRCTRRWCKIRGTGGRGWVSIDYLSFGQRPGGPFSGPKLNYPSGGPGLICFYEGTNYSGASMCSETGTVIHDLVLYHKDNRFSSVRVEGNVSALVCRDFNFTSYCERIIESKPRLPRYLIRNVSSYRVY